ncbi:hypothetical protein ANO11243_006420 [Dothideomycetidae sp. 11243]|nr:hypothetical protein ANO11243_006420 [fungal sp. No.11243]
MTDHYSGYDLAGNTFWEFKDQLNANRLRRIVKYSRKTHHADVLITPQWHQWLRHTRVDAPSIQEQQFDVIRRERAKQLAAEADARWANQASFLDAPKKQQPESSSTIEESASATHHETADRTAQRPEGGTKGKLKQRNSNPFGKLQQGVPAEGWQPQAWSPNAASKR